MVLAEEGQVWNWGGEDAKELYGAISCTNCCLFSRTTYELSTENLAFVRLETKDGTPALVMWSHASRIAGGGYHCLALTGKVTPERHDEGQVLSWGFDGHCQLGHSSIQCQKIPAVIDALADQHAIHVTCGGSSLAAITVSLSLRTGGSGMDTRSKARTLSGPVSDPSKLPKWNHDGSQFYCSAGTNASFERAAINCKTFDVAPLLMLDMVLMFLYVVAACYQMKSWGLCSYSCYHQLAEIHHENDPHKYASPDNENKILEKKTLAELPLYTYLFKPSPKILAVAASCRFFR
ncbi:hypothetical protein NC653_027020 [Populus alba x Populus x berolinensis]|uniref:Uncharacterized protein n=1 Tax=Populus alba x Populus x berolinensis TaxID=444605 RepID=A0AAD6M4A8_9ROSI|nr:hypothetical protein NC653_027020 [Populus alba x Populus x berolinensis]